MRAYRTRISNGIRTKTYYIDDMRIDFTDDRIVITQLTDSDYINGCKTLIDYLISKEEYEIAAEVLKFKNKQELKYPGTTEYL